LWKIRRSTMKASPEPIVGSTRQLERRARADSMNTPGPGAAVSPRPAAQLARPSVDAPPAPPADEGRRRKGLSIEDAGMEMLLLFTVAAFAVVGAVWLTASVDSWWILLPAMGIHLIATSAVLGTLWYLAGDGEEPDDPEA
jgi:hypothetical protein